mmetsp:Transcript_31956/g.71778  ORF Transcript_31956/g.71778 Transcript_31956/m.71778 type:complete len:611 (-) Transcript_31956:2892-4724(-)
MDILIQNEITRQVDDLFFSIRQKTIENARDIDVAWMIITGTIGFSVVSGVIFVEVGKVAPKNVITTIFKNLLCIAIAAISFWFIGYSFAFGKDRTGFIGDDGRSSIGVAKVHNGAGTGCLDLLRLYPEKVWISPCNVRGSDGWENWFFFWVYTAAATLAATYGLGERTKIAAYVMFVVIFTLFIHPIVMHWVWGNGWLSAWGAYPDSNGVVRPIFHYNSRSNGLIDHGGGAVVHIVAGTTSLVCTLLLGPRKARFAENASVYPGNPFITSLGVLFQCFGWYGLLCGSSWRISSGHGDIAAKVAVNTTISTAGGVMIATIVELVFNKSFSLPPVLNSVLTSLVSISAGASVVDPWMAFLIGAVSPIIYNAGRAILLFFKVDDVCEGINIYGSAGLWGLWSVGIFCTDKNVRYAGYPNVNTACEKGEQLGVQLLGSLTIIAWTAGISFFTIAFIDNTLGIRPTDKIEDDGLDLNNFGYTMEHVMHERDPTATKDEPAGLQPAEASETNGGNVNATADLYNSSRSSKKVSIVGDTVYSRFPPPPPQTVLSQTSVQPLGSVNGLSYLPPANPQFVYRSIPSYSGSVPPRISVETAAVDPILYRSGGGLTGQNFY